MDDLVPISRPEDDIHYRENSELGTWNLDTGRSEAEIPRTREYWILNQRCHPVGIYAVAGTILMLEM